MYIAFIGILISLIILGLSVKYYNLAKEIIVEKTDEKSQILKLQSEIKTLESNKATITQDIEFLKSVLSSYESEEKTKVDKLKIDFDNLRERHFESLDIAYQKAEEEYRDKIALLNQEYSKVGQDITNAQNQLNNLKETLSAGVQAQLREREKEDKLNYYKLSLNDRDLQDIIRLEQIKCTLSNPVILSKLIWTNYFQKQTNEMCNRVVGLEKTCGIYKITNTLTKQCYIGQSVDVAERFRQHIKCGLGIDASSTNKLYNAMQKDGVWNFTFEVIEKCSRDKLNEKERLWIEMYQSDIYSYNSTKGNK